MSASPKATSVGLAEGKQAPDERAVEVVVDALTAANTMSGYCFCKSCAETAARAVLHALASDDALRAALMREFGSSAYCAVPGGTIHIADAILLAVDPLATGSTEVES